MLLATLYIYIGSFFIVPKLQIYIDYLFYSVFAAGFCGYVCRKFCCENLRNALNLWNFLIIWLKMLFWCWI